ncbi:hypothetical protein LCGC14_2622780, partial [marine sediment metagenome]
MTDATVSYDEGYAAGRVFAGLDAERLAEALEGLIDPDPCNHFD